MKLYKRPGVLAAQVIAVLSAAGPVHSQTPATPQNTTVNVNYVYAASLGFGGYSLSGLTADVYTLPLSTTLPNVLHDNWSLKLLAPVQLGIYDFNVNVGGQRIKLDQQSISAVPGMELQIPINANFAIKPFAQGGVAHAFNVGSQNPDAWIYLAGVRSVAQWRTGAYTLSLGSGVIFAGDRTIGSGFHEDYTALQIGGEVRRPLGFTFRGIEPDLGVFAAHYYYPSPLIFDRFLQPQLKIENQNEVGFSIGSARPLDVLWLSNPRIGAGVVFGGGLTVYHVNFGFPF